MSIPKEIKTGFDLANRKILISCDDVIKYKMVIEKLTSDINILHEVIQVQNDMIKRLNQTN